MSVQSVQNAEMPQQIVVAPRAAQSTQFQVNPAPLISAIAGGVGAAVPGLGGVLGGLSGMSGDQLLPGLIDKQIEVQRETLAFNLRSNIVKAHHDARMSAVRNMKS